MAMEPGRITDSEKVAGYIFSVGGFSRFSAFAMARSDQMVFYCLYFEPVIPCR
jgi:hypothetical protein